MNTNLSIIGPVYNVENYIRACFESIFKQGLNDEDFEVIIVNDGSTDNSMEMIADIISQRDNITLINQENQGLSVARNNGISVAKGEYILMPDSDDLLIDNSLSTILDIALKAKVDLIVADFLRMTNEEIKQFKPTQQTKISFIEKTGEQMFLEDLSPYECYVWRSLFRREFLINNNLKFYPGIRYQDIPFTHECLLKAKDCIRTSLLLNIYRRRVGSATFSFRLFKSRDFSIAIALTWKLTYNKDITLQLLKKLKNDIYISLTTLLYFISHDENSFVDKINAIKYLRKIAPDMDFQDGVKQKFFSFLYNNAPFLLIYFRYIYGVIIEDMIRPYYRILKNYYKDAYSIDV